MRGHIRERSPGHWAIVIDVPDAQSGQRRRKWHAFRGTKREAQREAARLITEIGKGTYVERSRMTIAEFVASRIEQWAAAGEISTRSTERYRAVVRFQIEPHIGSRPLQKLTRLDLEAWHTALRNEGLAARTIGQAHRLLGKALRDAERDGLIVRNVAELQRTPKVKATEVSIVRDVPALVDALKGSSSPRLRVLAITALFTGMRLSEILALKDGRVDLERGVIQVREALEPTAGGINFKAPKTRAGLRDVSLPAIVIEVLREHRRELLETRMRLGLGRLAPEDLLFTSSDGGPAKPNTISVGWAQFAARIGMPEVTFHALRHTHASQLIAQGVDIVTISKRLGHANPNVTLGIYAHLFATDDRRAAAAINNALGSIG
jgi:integrase